MKLRDFNRLGKAEAEAELFKCCGSKAWASRVAALRPFSTMNELYDAAEELWGLLPESDWHDAFEHHPRIGDLTSLRTKWTSEEQGGVAKASEETLKSLAARNVEYEAKFGHLFLVCATGKNADEMLKALVARLKNSPKDEIRIAAEEQSKITRLRLGKLLESA